MRLIDADALPVKFWFGRFFGVAEIDIVNAPTVDAVEVVRCKDCVKWHDVDYDSDHFCEMFLTENENGYCSWGEKKDDK